VEVKLPFLLTDCKTSGQQVEVTNISIDTRYRKCCGLQRSHYHAIVMTSKLTFFASYVDRLAPRSRPHLLSRCPYQQLPPLTFLLLRHSPIAMHAMVSQDDGSYDYARYRTDKKSFTKPHSLVDVECQNVIGSLHYQHKPDHW